jgi:hypothetical protein
MNQSNKPIYKKSLCYYKIISLIKYMLDDTNNRENERESNNEINNEIREQ